MRLRETRSSRRSHIDRRERGTRRLRVEPKVKVACTAPERGLERDWEMNKKISDWCGFSTQNQFPKACEES
jgi:hypothetical protein